MASTMGRFRAPGRREAQLRIPADTLSRDQPLLDQELDEWLHRSASDKEKATRPDGDRAIKDSRRLGAVGMVKWFFGLTG